MVADARAVPAASLAPPRALEGLSLAIRTDGAEISELRRALAAAGTMGIRAGLMFSLDRVPPLELLKRAPFSIIERAVDSSTGDMLRTRRLITAVRAAHPQAILAVSSAVLTDGEVAAASVAPYIDVILDDAGTAPVQLERLNIARWTRWPRVNRLTVDDLVSTSLKAEGARQLQEVGQLEWDVLAAFVALRAQEGTASAARTLTVGEIVARHQAARARQEQLVQTVLARGTMSVAFEAPGFTAPITITADTAMYSERDLTDYELRDVRVNGAAIAGGNASSPPRLPLLEPRRLAVAPLVLTLDDAYAYELVGDEQHNGARRYVVAFRPLASDAPLARGTAWIDAGDLSLTRLRFMQTGLRGPIVSSEHDEELTRVPVGDQWVRLPTRTRIFQMYDGAGHRMPITRELVFDRVEVNADDFETRWRGALASTEVMLRDTEDGLRYLLRDSAANGGEGARTVALSAGERLRTVVVGVLDDPGITRPLPFAGFSYVDLNLFGTGTQIDAFFGGSYGQLSWSVPALGGPEWELHGRAFAIATRYNDRAFREGVERYEENLAQRPGHLSAGVTRRISPRLRLRADYELAITGFARADTTAPAFIVPSTAIVHGTRIAIEGERGGWSGRTWWNPARRQHWRPWGAADRFDRNATDFQRYGASVTRAIPLTARLLSRVEAGWMSGSDLDRFSRYGFDSFDNLLHGYSAASIRYDRGAVVRSTTSWTGRGWRVDAFADLAVVRGPDARGRSQRYPGIGAAFQAPGPFETLWSVEWGDALNPPRSTSDTHTLRITGYRTF